MLIDIAQIKVKAGKGGDGCLSFLRTKRTAFGGPNGGNGGNGGDVYLIADHNLATHMDFRSKEIYKAQNGAPGEGENMHGANGEDLYVRVPTGTLVYELENGKEVLVSDMLDDGGTFLMASGGHGGRGNATFKSSTNQAPRETTLGTKGEEKTLKLEIKLIADIGLVGLPNAGKSTLINQLTSANAKTANYPFTTLFPNLGTCKLASGQTVVIADIPGLIEGASEGKGLGDEFLRHIERTRFLIHIVEPQLSEDRKELVASAVKNYQIIRKELQSYRVDLSGKPEIVVINKLDITEVNEAFDEIVKSFKKIKVKVLGISAVTGQGIEELKIEMMKVLEKSPKIQKFEAAQPIKRFNISNLPNKRLVFKIPHTDEGR
ncbi:MAG: GTPase ObgE [Patescibacteria group bacterium]|jgi:GTP-binding protein